MNKRIQELQQKAWSLAWKKYIGPTSEIGSASPDEFYYFFAELIVEECCKAIQDEGDTYEVPDAGKWAADSFAGAVRKHFGVEE